MIAVKSYHAWLTWSREVKVRFVLDLLVIFYEVMRVFFPLKRKVVSSKPRMKEKIGIGKE